VIIGYGDDEGGPVGRFRGTAHGGAGINFVQDVDCGVVIASRG
jgi:hypothetical protein